MGSLGKCEGLNRCTNDATIRLGPFKDIRLCESCAKSMLDYLIMGFQERQTLSDRKRVQMVEANSLKVKGSLKILKGGAK